MEIKIFSIDFYVGGGGLFVFNVNWMVVVGGCFFGDGFVIF